MIVRGAERERWAGDLKTKRKGDKREMTNKGAGSFVSTVELL